VVSLLLSAWLSNEVDRNVVGGRIILRREISTGEDQTLGFSYKRTHEKYRKEHLLITPSRPSLLFTITALEEHLKIHSFACSVYFRLVHFIFIPMFVRPVFATTPPGSLLVKIVFRESK
jgi:hypothetical protein